MKLSALFSLFFVLSSFFLSPHNNYEKLLEVNAKTTADFLWTMDEPLLMSWLTADFRAVLVPGSIYNYILFCFVLFNNYFNYFSDTKIIYISFFLFIGELLHTVMCLSRPIPSCYLFYFEDAWRAITQLLGDFHWSLAVEICFLRILVLFFIADVTDSDWIISFDPNLSCGSKIQPICGQPFFSLIAD